MKRTSAEDVIIHALCPGPGVPTEGVVRPFGILPSLSLSGTVGSPLVRYASRPATRCSKVGVVAGAEGLAAPCCAHSGLTSMPHKQHAAVPVIVSFRSSIFIRFNRPV